MPTQANFENALDEKDVKQASENAEDTKTQLKAVLLLHEKLLASGVLGKTNSTVVNIYTENSLPTSTKGRRRSYKERAVMEKKIAQIVPRHGSPTIQRTSEAHPDKRHEQTKTEQQECTNEHQPPGGK